MFIRNSVTKKIIFGTISAALTFSVIGIVPILTQIRENQRREHDIKTAEKLDASIETNLRQQIVVYVTKTAVNNVLEYQLFVENKSPDYTVKLTQLIHTHTYDQNAYQTVKTATYNCPQTQKIIGNVLRASHIMKEEINTDTSYITLYLSRHRRLYKLDQIPIHELCPHN